MKQISVEQRYLIEAYLKLKKSKNFIAKELNIHRSSVFREVKRNCQKRGSYNAKAAHTLALEKKDRFINKRKFTHDCQAKVEKYIQEKWSPKQIVGYCKKHLIEMVSHERIYQFLREDKAKGGELYKHCRHRLKHRKRPIGKRFPIKDRVSIEERPEIVNKKTRFGDWEMDTIIGANHEGAILTLVERQTNFFMLKKLKKGKNAEGLKDQLINLILPYKSFIFSITTDNGGEFAEHKEIAKKLNTDIYFTHPYSSWEKGSIENTNKLIRQYIPKESNFNEFTDSKLLEIQHEINKRPREKLNFDCPKNIFYNLVNGKVAFDT